MRIDLTKARDYWQYGFLACGSTNWRANNGSFGCKDCGANREGLRDKRTGAFVSRDEIEFVGTHASWKAPYSAGREV